MKTKLASIAKGDDLYKFIRNLPETEVPAEKVDAAYIKTLGYSAASAASLANILKKLGFTDEKGAVSQTWKTFAASENKAAVLAGAVQQAYSELFKEIMYPYLSDDESILDYMRAKVDAGPREMEYSLETFRVLSSFCDFQDIPEEYDSVTPFKEPLPEPAGRNLPQVKIDPNVQMNIQIHIDPNTPDEKIETIFKYMRQYLLGR